MKARRAVALAALTVLVAAFPAGPAHAAGTGRITSPSAGAAVGSGTPLVVEVAGRAGSFFDPQDHTVQLRLADVSGAQVWGGTRTVSATCQAGDCGEDSTWTAGTFDPASLAPFGSTSSCNGAYAVQVRVDDGAWAGHAIRIARAPGAPSGVAVTPGTGEAEIIWDGASDPDVVGYRVERRAAGGSWTSVGQAAPSARAFTDDDVAAGDVEYRVVTLKGDGLVNGAPAQPCTDPDADLATPSAAVPTTVRSSSSASGDDPTEPSPSPSSSDGDGSGDGASGGDGSGDGGGDGSGDGSGDGAGGGSVDGDGTNGGSDGDGDQTGVAGEQTEGSSAGDRPSAGSRVAPPTALGTTTGPNVDVSEPASPDSPQVAEDRETFYGEGMEFSEELDFSELGEVDALGDTTVERRIRVPGGLQSVLGEELDLERLLVPLAAGLILLAFALHLRRWTRDGADV